MNAHFEKGMLVAASGFLVLGCIDKRRGNRQRAAALQDASRNMGMWLPRPGFGVRLLSAAFCAMERFCHQALVLAGALLLNPFCSSMAQGYSPEQAVVHMTLPAGLHADLVASEPTIVQPVAIEFDDRGRLWVIQYLQYPNPAGLQRVKVDRFSRTVYDKVPDPPPRGPKGADRITILEDTDGDGRADKAK